MIIDAYGTAATAARSKTNTVYMVERPKGPTRVFQSGGRHCPSMHPRVNQLTSEHSLPTIAVYTMAWRRVSNSKKMETPHKLVGGC
jgi:hypothetical protein